MLPLTEIIQLLLYILCHDINSKWSLPFFTGVGNLYQNVVLLFLEGRSAVIEVGLLLFPLPVLFTVLLLLMGVILLLFLYFLDLFLLIRSVHVLVHALHGASVSLIRLWSLQVFGIVILAPLSLPISLLLILLLLLVCWLMIKRVISLVLFVIPSRSVVILTMIWVISAVSVPWNFLILLVHFSLILIGSILTIISLVVSLLFVTISSVFLVECLRFYWFLG